MAKFRYVAVHPDRIKSKRAIGPASYLHDFLVDHQTDPEGRVYYGKAISYAWIRSRWPGAPPARSLKRHMARLKDIGCVQVTRLPFHEGMKVRVVGSAKWAPQAAQLQLFPPPEPVLISQWKSCEKSVRSLKNSGVKSGTAAVSKVALKSSKNLREEKIRANPTRYARSSPVEEAQALAARRLLLQQQSCLLQSKYKTSC
jgi:hypothetical protein